MSRRSPAGYLRSALSRIDPSSGARARSGGTALVRRVRRRAGREARRGVRLLGRYSPDLRSRLEEIGRRRNRPLISVVVPIYNVERYLDECLQSIRNQTYRRLQVILVDDGSTDGSAAIAAAHARADRRLSLVSQANAGLGAARNAGVRHARGRFLSFVDSDDLLVENAIETLWSSLAASGSDFAVGNLQRFTSARTWIPQWAREVHRRDLPRLSLSDLPEVLKDVFAWNKLFEADFFRRVVGSFPEGVRYEDQEPTARAYVNGTFDVLSAVVYRWREREDGTSITQQKSNQLDLLDRLAVKQRVARVIATSEDPQVRRSWFAKAAGFDLRPYYEVVPRTDQEFWTHLRTGVQALAAEMEPQVWQQIPLVDRLPALAVLHDQRADVASLMVRREENGWAIPATVVEGPGGEPDLSLRPDYLDGLSFEAEPGSLILGEPERRPVVQIGHVSWQDQRLHLDGFAYLPGLDLTEQTSEITVELHGTRTGRVIPVPIARRVDPQIDQASGDAWSSYAPSGFTTTIDTAALASAGLADGSRRRDRYEDLELRVLVDVGGFTAGTERIEFDHRGSAGRLPVGPMDRHGRWTIEPADGAVRLQHEDRRALRVEEVQSDGTQVRIVVSGVRPTLLEARCTTLSATLRVRPTTLGEDRTEFTFTVPEIEDGALRSVEHHWNLRAVVDGDRRRLMWPGSTRDLAELCPVQQRVRVVCSRTGALRIQQNHWWASVESISVAGDLLRLTGRLDLPTPTALTARLVGSDGIASRAATVSPSATDRFEVELPLRTTDGRLLSGGGRLLRISAVGEAADGTSDGAADGATAAEGPLNPDRFGRGIAIAEALLETFPLDLSSATTAVTCSRTRGGNLWIGSRLPYAPDERGRLAQRRLQQEFLRAERRPLRDAAVFECFNGKFTGDSVRALFEQARQQHPDWELYWSVADLSVPVPEGGRALLRHSRAWMETVADARYLVNNNNFPAYFRKRPGQVYVQTWHGTPLKRIGNDVPSANLSLSYRRLMLRDVASWDYLLAQNPFAAEILPAAFDYPGRVLDVGYPRNDSLVRDADRRADVRRSLGLGPDRLVVLYAPTWRDNVATSGRRYALVNYLDFDEAARRLPGVTFLLRGHANTVATADLSSPTVIDVSQHPDINELMIAADVLVTDYSSVMFDFCVTGRPMLFLVPDLEFYRDVTRGFYLPLDEIAPGPLCSDNDALLTQLDRLTLDSSANDYVAEHADRYRGFVDRFAPHDDGHAAARVAALVWPT